MQSVVARQEGTFFLLPPELRNEVYLYLAVAKKLALLRTCRATKAEMQPVVDAVVPCTIHVDGQWSVAPVSKWEPSGGHRPEWELHWSIPVSFPLTPSCRDRERWTTLGEVSRVRRRECRVFLHQTSLGWLSVEDVMAMGSLAGFERVEFRPGDGLRPPLPATGKLKALFALLPGALEPLLGPGQCGRDGEGEYLRFWPRRRGGHMVSHRFWTRLQQTHYEAEMLDGTTAVVVAGLVQACSGNESRH